MRIDMLLLPILSAANPYLENLKQGDWWNAIVGPFHDLIPGGMFFAILLTLVTGMIYIKTQSFGPSMIFFITGATVLSAVLPAPTQFLFMVFVALGITVVFTRIFIRRSAE